MPASLLLSLVVAAIVLWPGHAALASPPLAACLSREQVAVTVDDEVHTLEADSGKASRQRTISSKAQVWLKSFGAGVTTLQSTSADLSATLDDAKRRQATLLLHLALQGTESRLEHPYLTGDQYPLRTVRLVLSATVIDTVSRRVLSSPDGRSGFYARNSVEEALTDHLAQTFPHRLSEIMKEVCDDRASYRAHVAKANPPHMAKQPPPPPLSPKQKAEREEQINQFIRACVAGGSRSEVVAEGGVGGEFSLRRLLANGEVGARILFTKSSAEMLVNGITDRMSETAAREADAVRQCLKPMRDWMARTYFQ